MSLPRCLVPGATYLLTRRCVQRRFGLVPRGPTPQVMAYCIAHAAAKHGIQVHAVMCLSNHYHAVLTDPHGHISEFARDVHSLTARALNASGGRWEAFWSSQGLSLVRLVTTEDLWHKLVYTHTNPVAAGLVSHSSQWPGFRTKPVDHARLPLHAKRPRTPFFRRGRLPREVTLALSVPPQLGHLNAEAFAQQLKERVEHREVEIRAQFARSGRTFMGPRAVMRQRRDARPRTVERRRTRDPAVACRDTTHRLAALAALRTFRNQYADARARWLLGEKQVLFPCGTSKMRGYPNVVCERPPPRQPLAA